MKNFVLLFFLIIFSIFQSGCSSDSKTVSIPIYNDAIQEVPDMVLVKGINIASNYIKIGLEKGDVYYYSLNATVIPKDASMTDVEYVSSNKEVLVVNENGLVLIKGYGTADVTIRAKSNSVIKQIITFDVVEKQVTGVTEIEPYSILGMYDIVQYGINSEPNKNVSQNSNFSLNIFRNSDNIIKSKMLFNGFPVEVSLPAIDLSVDNYNAAKQTMEALETSVRQDNNTYVTFKFKASYLPAMIEEGLLTENDTISLSMKKVEDLYPNMHGSSCPENGGQNISVTQIELLKNEHTIDVKEGDFSYQIFASALPVNADNRALRYESSDTEIVTVNSFGLVTALKTGTADIKVYSEDNESITSSVKISVIDSTVKPESVRFTDTISSVVIDDKYTFKAEILPENADNKGIKYYVSDNVTAKIDENTGDFQALRQGSVNVIAVSSADAGVKATFSVNIDAFYIKPSAITNVPESLNIKNTTTHTLNPEVFPSYANNKALTYSTADGSIAYVNQNGEITAKKVGNTVITIQAVDNTEVVHKINLTVRANVPDVDVTEIRFNTIPQNLYINNTEATLKATTNEGSNINNILTAKSSDKEILAVYPGDNVNEWVLSPLKEGIAKITVSSPNGVKKEATINVYQAYNVQGYYSVESVKYQIYGMSNTFYKSEGSNKRDNLQGEMVVSVLDDQMIVYGRYQFTPSDTRLYMYNDWRYVYINDKFKNDSNDRYMLMTKNKLNKNNIHIKSKDTIEYHYTRGPIYAVVTMKKKEDAIRPIEDRTIFVTPLNFKNDVKSAEGYYQLDFIYADNNARYMPVFSGSCSDRPTQTYINIAYTKCDNWLAIMGGGGGPNSSVTSFKGEFVFKVTGIDMIANASSTFKMQKNGHQVYNIYWWRKFQHGIFDPVQFNQLNKNEAIASRDTKVQLVTSDNRKNRYMGAFVSYSQYSEDTLNVEIGYDTTYRGVIRVKKVSDRYTDLSNQRYAGEVNDRVTVPVPDYVKPVAIGVSTDNFTPIYE